MKNRFRILRRLAAALLLALAILPAAAHPASAELLPGLDGIGGSSSSAPAESAPPRESAPMPDARDGGAESPATPNSGAAWGVLIAVGIAALGAVILFLIMPSREEREEREKSRRR